MDRTEITRLWKEEKYKDAYRIIKKEYENSGKEELLFYMARAKKLDFDLTEATEIFKKLYSKTNKLKYLKEAVECLVKAKKWEEVYFINKLYNNQEDDSLNILFALSCINIGKKGEAYSKIEYMTKKPNNDQMILLVNSIYLKLEKNIERRKYLEMQAEIKKETVANNLLVEYYMQNKEWKNAESQAKKILKDTTNSQTLALLGNAQWKCKDYKEATITYMKMQKIKYSIDTEILICKGLTRIGNIDGAIVKYRDLIEQFEANNTKYEKIRTIYKDMACAYSAKNDIKNATKFWEKFYRKDINISTKTRTQQERNCKYTMKEIENIKDLLKKEEMILIPSVETLDIKEYINFCNIIYIHLPKCGGTSFHEPIDLAKEIYGRLEKDFPHAKKGKEDTKMWET